MSGTRIYKGHVIADRILEAARTRLAGRGQARAFVLADPLNPGAMAYATRLVTLSERIGVTLVLSDYARLDLVRDDPAKAPALYILPAPAGVDPAALVQALGPERDAEGLHPLHAGALALGRPQICPPTAQAAFRIAQDLTGALSGVIVSIVGASPIVGRPLALLLATAGATVRMAQASTRDLAGETRTADIVIAAAGVPGLITADHVRPGAIVIDVGATWRDGALRGDVDAASLEGIASVITHVPDGVGPVTSACLLENIARLVG